MSKLNVHGADRLQAERADILILPGDERPALAPNAAQDMPDPRAILNSIGETVYDWDIAADRLSWGANVCEILGLPDAGAIQTGIGYAAHFSADSPGTRYEAAMAACERDAGNGGAYQVQYGLLLPERHPNGVEAGLVWIEDTGRIFCAQDRRPIRAHGVIRVIAEPVEAQGRSRLRSFHDPLTGALNRAGISDQISRLFGEGNRPAAPFALLIVGLRGLADINKRHGYDAGDQVLAMAVQRLRENMRVSDAIGRYSGDKLALVLNSCTEEQMMIAARRLLRCVETQPFEFSGIKIPVLAQIGCALAPRHARNASPLLQRAEEALELARQRHLRQPCVYEPNHARDDARKRALRLSDSVISALNERRIALALQPVVNAQTRAPVFHEALLRLQGADGAFASAADILPVAEHAGLVTHIDHRILELALAQLGADGALRLAVNASAATLHDPEWPKHLAAALRLHPGAAERLLIEIGEASVIEDVEATAAAVKAIQALGVRVALDHFGSGHLSFRSLREIGFDLLKIDGAFMQNLENSADDRFFVRSLVAIARYLGAPVVAEWVETAAIADILDGWGVDFLQGYHFGAAVMQTPAQRGGDAKVA